jgi:hypothetical protein
MAISNLQINTAENIASNIRNNGQGAITGDLLQSILLLLNRDFFSGEIDCGFAVNMEDVEASVVNGRPTASLLNLLVEWYAGDFENTYIAVTKSGNIRAYLHLQNSFYLGDNAIKCSFLWNTCNDVSSFIVVPSSSDFEDSYIPSETVQKLGKPRVLSLNLPAETTSYSSRAQMLESLGINEEQLGEMTAGGYVYVYDRSTTRFLPFMVLLSNEIVFGYSSSQGEETYSINIPMNTVSVNLI